MSYIQTAEGIDLQYLYIDGSKFEANANKYTWVWKTPTEKIAIPSAMQGFFLLLIRWNKVGFLVKL